MILLHCFFPYHGTYLARACRRASQDDCAQNARKRGLSEKGKTQTVLPPSPREWTAAVCGTRIAHFKKLCSVLLPCCLHHLSKRCTSHNKIPPTCNAIICQCVFAQGLWERSVARPLSRACCTQRPPKDQPDYSCCGPRFQQHTCTHVWCKNQWDHSGTDPFHSKNGFLLRNPNQRVLSKLEASSKVVIWKSSFLFCLFCNKINAC